MSSIFFTIVCFLVSVNGSKMMSVCLIEVNKQLWYISTDFESQRTFYLTYFQSEDDQKIQNHSHLLSFIVCPPICVSMCICCLKINTLSISFIQFATAERSQLWVSRVLRDAHYKGLALRHSRCGTSKNPIAQWPWVPSIGQNL